MCQRGAGCPHATRRDHTAGIIRSWQPFACWSPGQGSPSRLDPATGRRIITRRMMPDPQPHGPDTPYRLARVSKDLEVSLSFPQVQAFSIFVLAYYLSHLRGTYRCRSKISKSRSWWGFILVV